MKETDYSVIQNEIEQQLLEQDWSIEEFLSEDIIVLAIANIYTTNDLVSGFGQDYTNNVNLSGNDSWEKLSIVSSRDRISIILDSKMSYYKDSFPVCGYESLETDIYNIFVLIQTVLDRISAQ